MSSEFHLLKNVFTAGATLVTVFGRANHLSISPSHSVQLSLLRSVGREMSTGQGAVTLCG